MGKYINPFTDFGFKKLFGEEANKKLLISFLNDILPISKKIVALNFKKNEQQGDTAVSRKAVYDIFCEDEAGSQFIVEMQNAKQLYFKDRAVFYATFPIRDAAKQGEWDFKLNPVYCVGLLGFEFDNKGLISSKEEEEIVEEAFKIAEVAGMTPEQVRQYEESLKIYRDNINVINTAKKEGYDEGKTEGKMEGKTEVAKNLLNMGIDILTVKKATGLTEGEINEM